MSFLKSDVEEVYRLQNKILNNIYLALIVLNLQLIIHLSWKTKMLKLQLWQVELFRGVILTDYSAMVTKGSV